MCIYVVRRFCWGILATEALGLVPQVSIVLENNTEIQQLFPQLFEGLGNLNDD